MVIFLYQPPCNLSVSTSSSHSPVFEQRFGLLKFNFGYDWHTLQQITQHVILEMSASVSFLHDGAPGLGCKRSEGLLCHSGTASTYHGGTPVPVGPLKVSPFFSHLVLSWQFMWQGRQEGVVFFSSHIYLPLFLCICVYSINSNGIEECSPEMFGSISPSRLAKQFLLHGVKKLPLNGKKNQQLYLASVKRILLLCIHTNPEQCNHLIFHLTI